MNYGSILTVGISVFILIGVFLFSFSMFGYFVHEQENIKQGIQLLQYGTIVCFSLGIYLYIVPVIELTNSFVQQFYDSTQDITNIEQNSNTYIYLYFSLIIILVCLSQYLFYIYWQQIKEEQNVYFKSLLPIIYQLGGLLGLSIIGYFLLNTPMTKQDYDKLKETSEGDGMESFTRLQKLSFIQIVFCWILIFSKLLFQVLISFGLVDLITKCVWRFKSKPHLVEALFLVMAKTIIKSDIEQLLQGIQTFDTYQQQIGFENNKEIAQRMKKSMEQMDKEINYEFIQLQQKMEIYDTLNVLDDNSILKAYACLCIAIFLILYKIFYFVEYIMIIINNQSIMEKIFAYLQIKFPTVMSFLILLQLLTYLGIIIVCTPSLFGIVFKTSFNEYHRDMTYMNVLLISAIGLCATGPGFMEYLSVWIDYYKTSSIIDSYIEEVVEKSYQYDVLMSNLFLKILHLLVIPATIAYQLMHKSSWRHFLQQIEQEKQNYLKQKEGKEEQYL